MIVEGLARSGSKEARSVAEDIVVRWIRTNYVAYKRTGKMHEKYNVEKSGERGGGGKYLPQVCLNLLWKEILFVLKTFLSHKKWTYQFVPSDSKSFLGYVAMQTGFGWSNGVVLAFLEEFGWPQDQKIDC